MFDYKLIHLPGTQMIQSDTLSRQPDLLPSDDDEPEEVTLLPKERFIAHLKLDDIDGIYDVDLRTQIIKGYSSDKLAQQVLSLRTPDTLQPATKDWELRPVQEGPLLLYQGRTYVPDDLPLQQEILRRYHDAPTAGHPSQQATRVAL